MRRQIDRHRLRIEEYILQKVAPYPKVGHILRFIYSLCCETGFLVHALFGGKLLLSHRSKRFSELCPGQRVLEYSVTMDGLATADSFRHWLRMNVIQFCEGRWTFYLPPQDNLSKHFVFLADGYPSDAGLKILKDFRPPAEARYVDHKRHPSAGQAIKRHMIHSPVSLLRVANYLYLHGLGMRVYDLVGLRTAEQTFTCYIVQHVHGREVTSEDYGLFMKELKRVMTKGEMRTIHGSIEMMSDFIPTDCKRNLIINGRDETPLYVDFQGFLLDEAKWLNRVMGETTNKERYGDVQILEGNENLLHRSISGLAIVERDSVTRWKGLLEMLQEDQCSLDGRVVYVLYEVGCNMGLMLYNALAEGAQWGIGWGSSSIVENAKEILFALGISRFDLFDEAISEKTDFLSRLPVRYKRKRTGVLFFFASSGHIEFPNGVRDLPWEYMFYAALTGESLAIAVDRLRSTSWVKDTQIISQRWFADSDGSERAVLMLKREVPNL